MSSAAGSFDLEGDLEVIEFAFRKVHGRPVNNTTASSGLATASSGDSSAVLHTGAIGVDEKLAGIVSSNEAMDLRHTVDFDARWEKGLWCIVRIGRIELGRKDTSCTDSAIIVVAASGHDWVNDYHEGTHFRQKTVTGGAFDMGVDFVGEREGPGGGRMETRCCDKM